MSYVCEKLSVLVAASEILQKSLNRFVSQRNPRAE